MSGTMTFYESDDPDCQPIVRNAGEGYLDTGDRVTTVIGVDDAF